MSSQQKSLLLQLIVEAVDKAGNVLTNVKNSLDGVQNAAKNAGSATGQVGQQIEKNLKQAANVADELKKKLEDTGRALFGMGTALAGIGASLGLPLAAATKQAADFEAEMNKVKAFVDFSPNTDEAEKQFQKLTETARSFDQYAPVNVAQAITEIGKAGQNTEQIIASLAPTLNLAFVENRDMRQTAEDLVSIMNAMGMEANQTTRAADVLAKTSNMTTTSMGGLTEGMKFAAPVAAKLGMNIELTAAFLGQFAQNGIKGEMGGTGFRRVMEDLLKPTTEARATLEQLNVEIAKTPGGQVDAIKTFERLRDAQMNAAQAAAIFGTQGMTIALAATKDIEKIKALAKENDNASGSLQQTVDKINAGLNPALGRLTNALSNASIQFAGPFLTSLRFVVDGLASVIRSATEFGQAHPIIAKVAVGFVGFFAMIAAAAGAVTLALAGLSFGAAQMRAGWQVLIGMSARVTQFFRDKIGLIQRETQTINENTGALQRNAQARDAGERRGTQGIIAGKGGVASGARGPGIGGVVMGVGAGLLEGQLDLSPTENAIGKLGELGGMMAAFGPGVGTIIAGISSWMKVLTKDIWDLLDVWGVWASGKKSLDMDATLKAVDAQMKATMTNVVEYGVANGKSYQEMTEDMLSIYQKATGEMNMPAELQLAFGRVWRDIVTKARDAAAQVGNEWKNIEGAGFGNAFTEAAKGYNTLSGRLGAMKETLDTMTKGAEAFYATVRATDEINFGNLKNEVTALTNSQALGALRVAEIETQAVASRVEVTRQEYAEKKALREQEYAAAQAQIVKSLAEEDNASKREEILKEKKTLEKNYRDQSFAAEKALQDGIVSELKRQQEAIKSVLEERKRLEQEIRDSANEAAQAQSAVTQKSLTENQRFRESFGQTVDTLQRANAALPTMPEKAIELAKKARDEFKGLAQDVDKLNTKLVDTFEENNELLRNLAKKDMSPTQAWRSDVEHIKKLLGQTQDYLAKGEFDQADKLANKIKGLTSSLEKAPEGSGYTDKQARKVARTYLTAAIDLQEAAIKGAREYSIAVNDTITAGVGQASKIIDTARDTLLDANTKQLQLHGQQTEALIKQYETIIQQNNRLIEAQGGKGISAPDVSSLLNAAKEGAQAGVQGTQTQAQTAGPIGTTPGNMLSGSSLASSLNPEVAQAYEAAQKRATLERGQKLNTALAQFPELAAMLSSEDYQTAMSASRAQDDQMATRMASIKSLEFQAGAMDKMEARGYGVSPAWQAQFSAAFNKIVASLADTAGSALGKLNGAGAPGGLEQKNLETQTRNTDQMGTAVERFVGAVEDVAKTFAERILVTVNVDKGSGTITRY